MKIVIDIDDDYFTILRYDVINCKNDFMPYKMIANGTPLTEVFEDIKAEIDTYLQSEDFGSEYRTDVAQIIDKHIRAEGSKS